MLRDRIVVGIRDDVTRHKLLQQHDLTLDQAIDFCKASGLAAGRQLNEMATSEEVQLLKFAKSTKRGQGRGHGGRPVGEQARRRGQGATRRDRDRSVEQPCRYCVATKKHAASTERRVPSAEKRPTTSPFFSRHSTQTTRPHTEQIYTQIELELLSVVYALERVRTYVYAKRDVIVQTDHKPLLAIGQRAQHCIKAPAEHALYARRDIVSTWRRYS